MSDDVEQMSQEVNENEQINAEQLAEVGTEAVEDSTPETAEAEIEQVSVSDLVGTQPETDDTDKERNRLYAANRVKSKKLKELEAKLEAGEIPEEYAFKPKEAEAKPRVADFTNSDRLYDEFNGSEAIALAAYHEALDDWSAANKGVDAQRANHIDETKAIIAQQRQLEDAFEENVQEQSKLIKGLPDSLDKAVNALGDEAFTAIRNTIGKNAPAVLAVIGENKQIQAELNDAAATNNFTVLIQYLTRLEDRVKRRLPTNANVSKAKADTPLSGGTSTIVNYDAAMEKAAKAADYEEYKRLKALKQANTRG